MLNTAFYTIDPALEGHILPQPWVTEVEGETLLPLLDGWADEPRCILAVSSASYTPHVLRV